MDQLTLTQPDDWHLHVRDDDALRTVVPYTARQFGRAIIMPNLVPPVTTTAQALAYRDRILAAVPTGLSFQPLMTLYLTDNTPAAEIAEAKRAIARLTLPIRPIASRRTKPASLGNLPDWRRTMRASMRNGGVPILARRERRERWPALVALCDISGSMASYSRMLLQTLPNLTGEREERLQSIAGQPPTLRAPLTACPFAARCPQALAKCHLENPRIERVAEGHEVACWWNSETGGMRDV